jgi:uncharacterized protein YifE (UPF0438 family)
MALPPDHAAALVRTGFPVPAGDWTPAERDLLNRFGHWMSALADGSLAPVTPDQERFVAVARGAAEPRSDHERVWAKWRQAAPAPRAVGADELAARIDRLQAARIGIENLKDERAARRAAILKPVQPELDALDAEFAALIAEKEEAASLAESDVRDAALAYGASYKHAGVHAVYSRGRATWDGKGLAEYARDHPEVEAFKKVGEPSVSLRFEKAGDEG